MMKKYKIFVVIVAIVMLSTLGVAVGEMIKYFNNSSDSEQPKVKGFVQITYTKTCIDGVVYLIADSGLGVKFNRDGKIETCD